MTTYPSVIRVLYVSLTIAAVLTVTFLLHYSTPTGIFVFDKQTLRCTTPAGLIHGVRVRKEFNRTESRNITLVILIMLDFKNQRKRDIIRKTWGGYKELSRHAVEVIFVFGRPHNTNSAEIPNFSDDDTVFVDADDDYNLLTAKVLKSLAYFRRCYPMVRFVMKADMDTYVNVPNLMSLLAKQKGDAIMLGKCFHRSSVIRDSTNKWFVAKHEYRDDYYPPYLSGGAGYVLTNTACRHVLAEASARSHHLNFPLEDVYITGLLRRHSCRISLVCSPYFWDYWHLPRNVCEARRFVTSHGMTNSAAANAMYNITHTIGNAFRSVIGLSC